MATEIAVDEAKTAAFMEKAFTDLVGTVTTYMVYVGDRLNLFKELAAGGPATHAELAVRADISERYAREWLSGMACAGYLAYDSAGERFALLEEHAPILAEEGGPLFLGGPFQAIPLLGNVLDGVVEAFKTGGGVPQSAYDERVWEGMERETAPIYEHALVQQWLPAAPDVIAKLERGAFLADIGCGSGRAVIKLAQAYPNARFVGYDAFAPQVERARANAILSGVTDRVQFEVLDAARGLPEQYDIVTTFDVVHDAVDPRGLLRAIRKGLRDDGIYLIQEYTAGETLADNIAAGQLGTFLYGASVFYCMTTSLAHGGEGLGTAGMPESTVRELCLAAGFGSVRKLEIDDFFHSVYEVKP